MGPSEPCQRPAAHSFGRRYPSSPDLVMFSIRVAPGFWVSVLTLAPASARTIAMCPYPAPWLPLQMATSPLRGTDPRSRGIAVAVVGAPDVLCASGVGGGHEPCADDVAVVVLGQIDALGAVGGVEVGVLAVPLGHERVDLGAQRGGRRGGVRDRPRAAVCCSSRSWWCCRS